MKKIFEVFSLVLLISLGVVGLGVPNIVHAEPASPLTSYKIVGYSWPSLYSGTKNYYPVSNANSVFIPGSTVYIVAEEFGYGNPSTIFPYVDGSLDTSYKRLDHVPAYYQYGTVVGGWYDVIEIDNVSPGWHTFGARIDGLNNGGQEFYDSAYLNVSSSSIKSLGNTNNINLSKKLPIPKVKK